MAVFAVLKSDDRVFEGDKIRFDGSESFITPDDTWHNQESLMVSFDNGTTWIDISNKKYIDYGFATSGTKTVLLRAKNHVHETNTATKVITVLDLVDQKLFSNDSDLYFYEPEIDQYLPKRWSSWNLVHLKAQEHILDWLDEIGAYKADGSKFTAADFGDSQQVKQLSCYKALEIIFEGNSNVVGDLFSIKRDKYKALVLEKLNRSNLRLDYDDNGTIGTNEKINLFSGELTRG